MIRYLLRRFANYIFLTALATVLSYMACSAFMDPSKRYQGRNPPLAQSSIDSTLDAMGINPKRPVIERTLHWMNGVAHGSLGKDFSGQEVTHQIMIRAGVSLRLLIIGALLAAVVGVALGVWGAVRQYHLSDQIVTYASYVLLSTPTFVAGVLLMIAATWFNRTTGHQWINFTGEYTPGISGTWATFTDRVSHMLLPTLSLVMMGAASYSRYQRSIMLDVLGSDYIRTARAKGATRNRALVKHGVRVALIPMSTFFAYSFGTMLAGATFLELVFSWNGMGQYSLTGVQGSDINAVAGSVLFAAVLVLLSSMLSEVLYATLDPRVRV